MWMRPLPLHVMGSGLEGMSIVQSHLHCAKHGHHELTTGITSRAVYKYVNCSEKEFFYQVGLCFCASATAYKMAVNGGTHRSDINVIVSEESVLGHSMVCQCEWETAEDKGGGQLLLRHSTEEMSLECWSECVLILSVVTSCRHHWLMAGSFAARC